VDALGLGGDDQRRKGTVMYVLFLLAFLAVQFGHGANIGVAVSLQGNSKAMNLALGSWVMVGVCLGLPLTPWACKTWGIFHVCKACVLIDFLAILLMLWPGIGLRQIYFVRFLVGFFEAPFLPYLQEWLARFGKHTWNVWNTVLHAMVPLGENLGYIIAQELVEAGSSWQWAFAGQAVVFLLTSSLCYFYGGRRYLDLSYCKSQTFVDGPRTPPHVNGTAAGDECSGISLAECAGSQPAELDMEETANGIAQEGEVEYPMAEKWCIYWATNVSLAAQLGFLSGSKYVIRDYALKRGFSLHFVIFAFSAIALLGPALGGSIAMSGSIIRPDQWSQHKRTLLFLTCTASVAAGIAILLPHTLEFAFWPSLLACFIAAGGVYPAAQGVINIALTATRVVEASVYQVQCNNILFAMPMPYFIGMSMDWWGVDASFRCVTLLQVLTAVGFAFAFLAASCTEERNTWHRLRESSISQDLAEGATS
jgi:hypothetical protein